MFPILQVSQNQNLIDLAKYLNVLYLHLRKKYLCASLAVLAESLWGLCENHEAHLKIR